MIDKENWPIDTPAFMQDNSSPRMRESSINFYEGDNKNHIRSIAPNTFKLALIQTN